MADEEKQLPMDEDPNSPESEKPSETNPPAVSSNDNSIAAATASTASGDGTIAQALYTVEALTNLFGFDIDVANIAVQEVGTDVTACYNYILDSGLGEDKGGAIHPIDSCPHVSLHVKVDSTNLPKDPQHAPCSYFADKATGMAESGQEEQEQQPARAKDDDDAEGTCPLGENWCCLECGKVRCSRYVNGHGLVHWKETKTDSNPSMFCVYKRRSLPSLLCSNSTKRCASVAFHRCSRVPRRNERFNSRQGKGFVMNNR